jgi:flagellar basal-body rod protein FlgF
LLGSTGQPIAIPDGQAGQIRIAQDGSVTGPQGELGRLSLVTFSDESKLMPIGSNMFSAGGMTASAAPLVKLQSGGLESSNVQPLVETTQMIEVLRSYQNSKRALEDIRDLRAKAIEKLGQLG